MASKTKAAAVVFTDEETKAIKSAAYAVFNECAYDILQAVAEDRGKDVNRVTVSRAEAIEVALDAGRVEDRMRWRGGLLTPDLLARWQSLDYPAKIKLVKPAFPYARYGM